MKNSTLDLDDITEKIGSDGLYYYEIEDVGVAKLGNDEIDG